MVPDGSLKSADSPPIPLSSSGLEGVPDMQGLH